jgi:hypothetical protein
MHTTYIAISIIALVIVALLVYFVGRKGKGSKLTPLAGLAFGLILAGLFFGANRWFGYALLGAGVVLAVIDMINRSKLKKNHPDPGSDQK